MVRAANWRRRSPLNYVGVYMARYCILNDQNVVIDIVEADSALDSAWVLVDESLSGLEFADIGSTYNAGTNNFTPATRTSDENKSLAKTLLVESDWAVLEDVGLTGSNLDEWKSYRAALRAYIKSPTSGNANFPAKPDAEYK